MKRLTVGLALLTTLLLSPAAAAAQGTLEIRQDFVVNGVVLGPGDYGIEIGRSLDTVTLTHGRKAVVTAPCTVSPAVSEFRGVEVHSRRDANGRDEIVRLVLPKAGMAIDLGGPDLAAQPDAKSSGALR